MQFERSHCGHAPFSLPPGDRWLCVLRVAERLGCTDRNVRYLIATGQLPAYYDPETPKILKVRLSDVIEYRRRNPVGAN